MEEEDTYTLTLTEFDDNERARARALDLMIRHAGSGQPGQFVHMPESCTLSKVYLETVLYILPRLIEGVHVTVAYDTGKKEVLVNEYDHYLAAFWKRCPSPLVYTLTFDESGETKRYSNLDVMLNELETTYKRRMVTIGIYGVNVCSRHPTRGYEFFD